jgi:excisionase family DNA binding protein
MPEKKSKKGTPLFQQKTREGRKIRAMTLLTTQEAAERLRLRRETVLEYIRAGKIKAIQFNKRIYRIQEKDLDRFIKQCQKK